MRFDEGGFNPGRIPDPPDERDHLYRAAVQREALPRPSIRRSNLIGPVLNQGKTPHCVTYATTALKNRHERIQHRKFLFQEHSGEYAGGSNPAAEWLYRYIKDNKIDAWPDGDGTNARAALTVAQTVGIPGSDGTFYKIGQYARCTTVEEIMESLHWHNSTILLGMAIDSTWWNPLDPGTPRCRLAMPNDDIQGGHEVEVVGYRDRNTLPVEMQGLWIQGSWDTDYGYNGRHRLPFEHLEHYDDWDAWWVSDAEGQL